MIWYAKDGEIVQQQLFFCIYKFAVCTFYRKNKIDEYMFQWKSDQFLLTIIFIIYECWYAYVWQYECECKNEVFDNCSF